jgi:hypothetical protein
MSNRGHIKGVDQNMLFVTSAILAAGHIDISHLSTRNDTFWAIRDIPLI